MLYSFENDSFHLNNKSEDSKNGVRVEAGGLSQVQGQPELDSECRLARATLKDLASEEKKKERKKLVGSKGKISPCRHWLYFCDSTVTVGPV